MRTLAILLVLAACNKPKTPLRPLATGTFGKYKIEPCATGGHVVKLTSEVDERGEAANKLLVESYRDRYLLPRLKDRVEYKGSRWDGGCGAGGLVMTVNTPGLGEALHLVGETLAKNPTDIEVTVVGPK